MSIPDFSGSSNAAAKTSRLHYLVVGSHVKKNLCANIVTALANRYPFPTMIGYHGKGDYDVKASNLGKLRAMRRYLIDTPNAEDDDLVIVIDGYDVLAQLPAQAMIEIFFETMARHDKHLADRFGLTVEQARERGLYTGVLWGADKGCYPPMFDEPQCWGLPPSFLPHNVYGRSTHDGSLAMNDPVYVNAGTVMARVGSIRELTHGDLLLINNTFSEDFKYKKSDQYIQGKMYANQEVNRTKALTGGLVPGLEGSRYVPKPSEFGTDRTDYHISVDFESAFTVTQCGNEGWMHNLKFNRPDGTGVMDEDVGQERESFKSFPIQMPGTIRGALTRLYESIPHKTPAEQWLKNIKLGTNVATGHIYGMYHGTCNKSNFMDRYKALWTYHHSRALMRATTEAFRKKQPLADHQIDGRTWVAPAYFPEDSALYDPLGGVYTDSDDPQERFIPMSKFCSSDLPDLIN